MGGVKIMRTRFIGGAKGLRDDLIGGVKILRTHPSRIIWGPPSSIINDRPLIKQQYARRRHLRVRFAWRN